MGRRLIDYSQVLGKPTNQEDIRGAGVAYSVWEKEELLTTLFAGENLDRRLTVRPLWFIGLARGCLVAEPATRLRLGGTVESGRDPGTLYLVYFMFIHLVYTLVFVLKQY